VHKLSLSIEFIVKINAISELLFPIICLFASLLNLVSRALPFE